jgi:hypothetical protein
MPMPLILLNKTSHPLLFTTAQFALWHEVHRPLQLPPGLLTCICMVQGRRGNESLMHVHLLLWHLTLRMATTCSRPCAWCRLHHPGMWHD